MFIQNPFLPKMPPASFHSKRVRDQRQQGVTILEWLTAMSILLIATTAIIGMQSTSMQAHKVSDDVIVANNLALQSSEVLQADALRWRQNLTETLYFANPPATVGNPNWRALTFSPVNFQFSTKEDFAIGPASVAWNNTAPEAERTYTRAQFCVFYTYRWVGADSPGVVRQGVVAPQAFGDGELLEVTVVVTWPYSPLGLSPTLRTFHDGCGSTGGAFNSQTIENTIASGPSLATSGASTYLRQVRHSFFVRRDLAGGI
ncbi:hypothetical protein L6R29_04545 [Myxococcota bacterium]|nr:hypothetical protein [Myxococcota bacterium]